MAEEHQESNWDTEKEADPWVPETVSSLFEDLMAEVSRKMNEEACTVIQAALEVLGQKLHEDEVEENAPPGTIEVISPTILVPPTLVSIEDRVGGTPEIPVNYLIREFIDMVTIMRTKPPPGTPPMFKGIAYQYPSAIYSLGLYSGLCTMENNLKNRAEMRKALLYQRVDEDDERGLTTGQMPFKWRHLFPGPIPGRDKLTHVWCLSQRLKDRAVRIVADYPASSNSFVAQTSLAIVLANMKTYKSIDVGKARKEVPRLYKWYNSFHAPYLPPDLLSTSDLKDSHA